MDVILKNLNRFAAGMMDISITRNPLSQEAILIFNTVSRDHYQDAVIIEESRAKKRVMVKKDLDMNYVQELGDILVEDVDSLPWVISLTITDLPRQPKMDDQIIIEGRKYTISMVKPSNRNINSILLLMIYPERSEPIDDVAILDLKVLETQNGLVLDILYSGWPTEYSFDGNTWKKFTSYILLVGESRPKHLYVRDASRDTDIREIDYGNINL